MQPASPYAILFEPVKIGPVTTKNRFYQVPHANGMGDLFPEANRAYRAMRAEGGWGVVSSSACDMHFTSDHSFRGFDRIWDDSDIPVHAKIAESVHKHGALAAVELNHSGIESQSFMATRIPHIGFTSTRGWQSAQPFQTRVLDREDIRNLRRWNREAALRAKAAGYDIIYIYAAHGNQITRHFLSPERNTRSDEYGGSLENRARLIREFLTDAKEAVGDRCAVAFRFTIDDQDMVADPALYRREAMELVEILKDVPDLWDVNRSWPADAPSSRFAREGEQEDLIRFVKQVTEKPVVGVGRFTSPDTMVRMVKSGLLDLIGAARPSIADPFLPNKLRDNRLEEIRECIGCNHCLASTTNAIPLQCTQNPTAGEEFRRGWHPEIIAPKSSEKRILVIGSGPAGLEAATALGRRGYDVALAEKSRELGGRVTLESRLPGLNEWARVRDHRLQLLQALPNVEIFRESELSADDILELRYDDVVIATGAKWRSDGVGSATPRGISGLGSAKLFTPDQIISGSLPISSAVIYDDDHNYMAAVLAELLIKHGCKVTLVTPAMTPFEWSASSLDQANTIKKLSALGVEFQIGMRIKEISASGMRIARSIDRRELLIDLENLVLVTNRNVEDRLYRDLMARSEAFADHKLGSVTRIGDCYAPATISAAVFAGHDFARQFDSPEQAFPFLREHRAL